MSNQIDIDKVLSKLKLTSPSYERISIGVKGTEFTIVDRVEKGMDGTKIADAIKKSWPHFVHLFGPRIEKAIVADFEAPIGGGPLSLEELYTVGIFSMDPIPAQFQDYIARILNWKNQYSTMDYIKENYKHFDDPIQAYIDDMVIHELGHYFFGFGITKTDFTSINISWVALGLGMVYDRLVWDKFYNKPSPMFENVEALWRDKFSKIKEIDQRLVNPDTSMDSKYNLERLQTYCHGKAYPYLRDLRKKMGIEYFDSKIIKLIDEVGYTETLTYELLLKYLMEDLSKKSIIEDLEQEYHVR